jgi:hypothetical protein
VHEWNNQYQKGYEKYSFQKAGLGMQLKNDLKITISVRLIIFYGTEIDKIQ